DHPVGAPDDPQGAQDRRRIGRVGRPAVDGGKGPRMVRLVHAPTGPDNERRRSIVADGPAAASQPLPALRCPCTTVHAGGHERGERARARPTTAPASTAGRRQSPVRTAPSGIVPSTDPASISTRPTTATSAPKVTDPVTVSDSARRSDGGPAGNAASNWSTVR